MRVEDIGNLDLPPDGFGSAIVIPLNVLIVLIIDDRRDYIGRLVLDFEALLAGQDERTIAPARAELTEALDQLEGTRYL